ncbi:MAG: SBBP repeat-containing protein [Acidobacteria bacterium]|nr:SBBP repeat-containing protein [Acidobacteriota bacterium]
MARIYPGIDAVVYFQGDQFEFDFEVAPGANPDAIHIALSSNRRWQLPSDGGIEGGGIRVGVPIAHQSAGERTRQVGARFVQDGRYVRLQLDAYEQTLRLVIDPLVTFARYTGGKGRHNFLATAVDDQGNSYTGGTVVTLPNSLQTSSRLIAETGQIFVTKFDPAGRKLYTTYIAGVPNPPGSTNIIYSMAATPDGQLVIAGGIEETSEMPLSNAAQPRHGGSRDGFLMKLNSNGSDVIFSTYLGGIGSDEAHAVAIGPAGEIVVTGYTSSTAFPSVAGNGSTFMPDLDLFLAKYSAGGQLMFSTLFAAKLQPPPATSPLFLNTKIRNATSIAMDKDGEIYVGGYIVTESFVQIIGGEGPLGSPPAAEAFAAKLDPSGKRVLWTTYVGGNSGDYGYALAVDSEKNVYLGGTTASVDFPVKNAFQPKFGGGRADGFLTKLNTFGQVEFATYIGGEQYDIVTSLMAFAGGISAAGDTESLRFPLRNAIRATPQQGEAFYSRVSSDGSQLLFSTYIGGSGYDYATKAAASEDGSVAMAMLTGSTDITGIDAASQVDPSTDVVLLRLRTPITARPAQVALSRGADSQTVVLDTKTGQAYSATVTTTEGGGWLKVTPTNGTTTSATTLTVSTRADAVEQLATGVYRGTVIVHTGEGGVLRIPVTIEIPAQLKFTPERIEITAGFGASMPQELTVAVSSGVTATQLSATATMDGGGSWLRISPAQFATPGTLTVSASPNSLAVGTYTGTVTLRSGTAVAATVPVRLRIVAATANPATVRASANRKDVNVEVTFAAGLAWTALVDESWVSILSGAAGSGPGVIQLRIAENTTGRDRTATLRAGSVVVPIAQAGPLQLSTPARELGFRLDRDLPRTLTQSVAVTSGEASVEIEAASSESWLDVQTKTGQTPGNISIRATPNGLQDGLYRGQLIVRSESTVNELAISVALTVAPSGPLITRAGLVSAAALEATTIVPNQILSLFGSALQCASTPTVSVGGLPATVLAVTAGQVNFSTPQQLAGGAQLIVYNCANSESAQLTFGSGSAAPALFTANSSGRGQAAAINDDGSLNGPASAASAGGVIQLFGSGFGEYESPGDDGLVRLRGEVRAAVGGVPARVSFAGQAPGATNGLQQINLILNRSTPAGDAVSLEVAVGNNKIQSGVTIAVQGAQ